jgi:uncharacterized protein (TIGR00255 family)
MTGFGKAVCEWKGKKITVEIKSLNSKQCDLNLRLPSLYKSKEHELRTLLAKEIERGRIDLNVFSENLFDDRQIKINHDLAKHYHQELKEVAASIGVEEPDYLLHIMKMPDVISTEKYDLTDDEWEVIFIGIKEAISSFHDFRTEEGRVLKTELLKRIKIIFDHLENISVCDPKRIENIKNRIRKNLKEFIENESFDVNRFEQELIYYLEKIDITEEKVRLKAHLDYFLVTIATGNSEGRKLGFIAQEIGREINTIGSKANDAEMQHLVVQMKDELEKIKEQLLNVL